MKIVNNKNKTRIGILGGTFDPPHKGHLYISNVAVKKLKLDKVIWVITKQNPFKKKPTLNIKKRIKLSEKIAKKQKKIHIRCFEKKINSKSFENFNQRINNIKKMVNFFLNENKGKIIGYGASTKGNIVLNLSELSSNQIEYICDSNKKKYGEFTPGSNIKIISKEKMRKLNPKFLLVLIWSFRSEIIKQEINYLKKGGSLIFHLPKFHIINKNNYRKYLNKSFKELSYNY